MTLLVSPSLENTCKGFLDSVADRKIIIIVASCTVNYSGRTGSRLGEGERLIILKEDGCVLVHRGRDYHPVNWQPSGCLLQCKVVEGRLLVKAVRPNPLESLTIWISKVEFFASFRLDDGAEFVLGGNEQDMQDAILTEPGIVEAGLQVMDFEKKVEPGFVDVYGIDKFDNTVVIEIKKGPAGISAVRQLSEYVKFIPASHGRKIRPIIVAPSLSKGAQPFMSRLGVEFKQLTVQKSLEILKKRVGSDQKQLRAWLEQVAA